MPRLALSSQTASLTRIPLSDTESESEYLRWIAGIPHNLNPFQANVARALL